ncbi:amidase signature domain-containing protein [Dipodascopsis uninucleata]
MTDTIGWTIPEWLTAQRESSSEDAIARIISLVSTYKKDDVAMITIADEEFLRKQWAELQSIPNCKDLPLYGVPFAPKDNIDVAGLPTTVACPAFKYEPEKDAEVIKTLKAAGAIPVCKTNMDQFATGLVGTRSPYGIVPSALSDLHCAGGSSSGSSNVVARGLVPFSLGSDTAGSGRVPAMHNNLIGLKPSKGALSATGVVPACRELDCVSIFAQNLPDSREVFGIVAKYDPADAYARPLPEKMLNSFGPRPRLAIPDVPQWFTDTQNDPLWKQAVAEFQALGVELVPSDFTPMYRLGACLFEGPWVAERYTVVRKIIENDPDAMDPTVRKIIGSATKFSAADKFDWEHLRRDLVREIETKFADCDGFLVPTAPMSPTIAEIQADPFGPNFNQGTYTNFVNFSDLAALAIPAGFRSEDRMPFGVTLISRKHTDYALLDLAQRYLGPKSRKIGALEKVTIPHKTDIVPPLPAEKDAGRSINVAVVGAHLKGLPLHYQLEDVKAEFVSSTTTSPNYKLYALKNTAPAKPGLRRVPEGGSEVALEIYSVPIARFGEFVALIPSPLGIGSIELKDGTWIKGFICEEVGYLDAADVSSFGGWKAYLASI